VLGVLAPGAFDHDRTAFWRPLVLTQDAAQRKIHWLTVHGRLKPEATYETARERLNATYAAHEGERSANDRGGAVELQPLSRVLVGPQLQRTIYVALGAVALVLVIACANVANLLLARGALRQREMAARAALGAARWRLVAQLLTEGLVLSLLGAAAGVAIAALLIQALTPVLATMLPFTAKLLVDVRLLAFAAGVAVVVCLVAGTVPAVRNSRENVVAALNRGSRGSSAGHVGTRRLIVIAEVALSLVLIVGALLLFKSLAKLSSIATGVRIENVTTASLDLPKQAYPTSERAAQLYEALTTRMRTTPGITHAALASHLPLVWIGNGEAIQIPGVEKLVRVRLKRVDSEYFTTLGIPLLSGRGITSNDRSGARRVVVINEALLKRLREILGIGNNPVGKVVRLSQPEYRETGGAQHDVEIVGVIRSERIAAPGVPDPAVAYVPLAQAPNAHIKIFVRSPLDLAAVAPVLRESVRAVAAALPLDDIATMEQVRQETLAGRSRPAQVIGAFALLAMILAAIGLCGVLSQSVTQRRREFGIRVALGAKPWHLLANVLKGAAALIIIGLTLGLLGAMAVTRMLETLLYEVSPLDPMTLVVGAAAMLTVGVLSALIPAARAARLDAVTTLREEG
jgi:putative ABC transport system permease protein